MGDYSYYSQGGQSPTAYVDEKVLEERRRSIEKRAQRKLEMERMRLEMERRKPRLKRGAKA